MAARDVTPEHLRIVSEEASRLARRLPVGRGVDREDLESAGNEALARAIGDVEAGTDDEFCKRLRVVVRGRMVDEVRRLTHRGRNVLFSGMPEDDSGKRLAMRDRSADDPAAAAAAAEYDLPDPAEVALKAARLKMAVLDAITPTDVRDIVLAQVTKAKAGRAAAAKLVLGLIAGQPTPG